jgi:hypothetical protein
MYTPFNKRATEYLPDGNALLSVVTPDFFKTLLEPFSEAGQLYDRLVRLIGTPGSGKTTLAKILQYENAVVVAQRRDLYRNLYDFFVETGFIERGGQHPTKVITRLPMESEYRTFGSLAYREDVRNQLLFTFIQARSVLGWIREIERTGISLELVTPMVRTHSPAVIEAAGASSGGDLKRRAAEVERAVYSIVAGIVPPSEESLPRAALEPYAPFDALEGMRISGDELGLLVILDDFHQLSKNQRLFMNRAFTRREPRVGRWTMMRYDALHARNVIANDSISDDELPNDVDPTREVVTIMMQGEKLLTQFNKIAPKMADQQLQQVPLLWNAGVQRLSAALSGVPPATRESTLAEVTIVNEKFRDKHRIGAARVQAFLDDIDQFVSSDEMDVRQQALRILLNRHVNRIKQTSLMDEIDPEPSRKVAADAAIVDAARLQLFNSFGRAYYYGLKVLTDAASGNAEQYLRLCDPLVNGLEVLWIQERRRELSAQVQNDRLLEMVREYRRNWTFPENLSVGRLVDYIAKISRGRAMEPTAPVPPGPNAIALPNTEFAKLFRESKYERLVQTLKFAIAYNVIALKTSSHKKKDWTVLQLNGLLCMYAGLPLAQGHYVDINVLDALEAAVAEK